MIEMHEMDSPMDDEFASTATMRLTKLHTLDPFYTPLEERFERITRLAGRALGVPVAAITIVQGERQWFKSVNGWLVTELPMSKSLCAEVIKTGQQIIVEDTLNDLYLMSNSFVCNAPKFRFYAGYPMKNSEGETVGSFCVMDVKPKATDSNFGTTFADLGDMAQHELLTTEVYSTQAALISKLGESRRQAMFDPLTRLWNRRGGMDLLDTAVREALKHNQTLGVCVADIDHFKSVNDRFGHPVGDQVLRKVASAIVAAVRPEDIVCRYGGEEFIIIFRDVDSRGCFNIASRVCSGIRELPIRTREATIPVTISIGIAMRDHDDILSAEQLLERADIALYKSKDDGRDRVSFATNQK
jgi:diguanylate cyclase (GGDEF)-like protein